MDERKVTIQEVADLAGVSLSTVSRVINNVGIVKTETRNRVLAAIEELGYSNRQEKKSQSQGIVLFNVPSVANPFYIDIINGARQSTSAAGYSLLLSEYHIIRNTLPEFMDMVELLHPVGILMANNLPYAVIQEISNEYPLVQCGEYCEEADLPYVAVDDIAAAERAVEYLCAQGKRKIAFLNGPYYHRYAKHRLKGYQQALEKWEIPFDPTLVINLPDVNYDVAYTTTVSLLQSSNRPDAFFTASDIFGVSVIRAAAKCGLRVPRDVSIVGFDNIDIAAHVVPGLTTVNQPRFRMGFSACELLIERIRHPETPVKQLKLDTEFIVRGSTAFSK